MRQVLLAGLLLRVRALPLAPRRVRHPVGVRPQVRGRAGAAEALAAAQVPAAKEQEGQEGVGGAAQDGGQ